MRDTYSLYEAKAKLSAIVRRVREGHHVTVTLHGEPVVEIRPVSPAAESFGSRLQQLAEAGILIRPTGRRPALRPVARRPGALKRFLDERE